MQLTGPWLRDDDAPRTWPARVRVFVVLGTLTVALLAATHVDPMVAEPVVAEPVGAA